MEAAENYKKMRGSSFEEVQFLVEKQYKDSGRKFSSLLLFQNFKHQKS